jgi:hypothetical protein
VPYSMILIGLSLGAILAAVYLVAALLFPKGF